MVICRILDNLPVAVPRQRRDGSQTPSYDHGFRVGYKDVLVAGVSCIALHFFINRPFLTTNKMNNPINRLKMKNIISTII